MCGARDARKLVIFVRVFKVGCIRALFARCFTVFLCAHDPFIVHLLLTVQTEKFWLSYPGFPSKKGANTRYDMFWTKVISKFLLDSLMFYSTVNCTYYYEVALAYSLFEPGKSSLVKGFLRRAKKLRRHDPVWHWLAYVLTLLYFLLYFLRKMESDYWILIMKQKMTRIQMTQMTPWRQNWGKFMI